MSQEAESTVQIRGEREAHIEVYKFHSGAVAGTALAALLLQTFLPIYVPRAAILDLPLLLTLYFGLSRRNPSAGLLLGTVIGLLQDSLSRVPLGLYGIAKTFVGFVASSIGGRLDVEHPISRFGLTFLFFYFHHTVFAVTKRLLLAQPEAFSTWALLLAAVVNAVFAVGLFPLLDRLRKAS